MTIERKFKKVLLGSASLGALMFACSGGATAQTVALDPLAGGAGTIAATASAGLDTDISGGSRVIDFFTSDAVNSQGSDNAVQNWGFNITNTMDGELNNGDSFTELFAFNIQLSRPPATGIARKYAEDDTDTNISTEFNSYLFFEVTAQGFIGGLDATGTTNVYELWSMTYTDVTFDLFLDENGGDDGGGSNADGHDRDVHLASFTGTGQADAFAPSGNNFVTDIFWNTTMDCVNDSAWLIGGVNPASGAANGCVDLGSAGDFESFDTDLSPIAFKLSSQQVFRTFQGGTAYSDAGGNNPYLFDTQNAGQGNHEFVVPEPTSAALLGSGLVALGALARRRFKNKA